MRGVRKEWRASQAGKHSYDRTELRTAQKQRNTFQRRAEEAEKLLVHKKVTSKESLLGGRKSTFDKFSSRTSSAWYDQCRLLKEWIEPSSASILKVSDISLQAP